jgi:hypothetical protein
MIVELVGEFNEDRWHNLCDTYHKILFPDPATQLRAGQLLAGTRRQLGQ